MWTEWKDAVSSLVTRRKFTIKITADCFEGSIFKTGPPPAGFNTLVVVQPISRSFSFCSAPRRLFRQFWFLIVIKHTFEPEHGALTPPFSRPPFYSVLSQTDSLVVYRSLWKAPPQDQTVVFQTGRVQLGTAAIKAITFPEIYIFKHTVVLSNPAPNPEIDHKKEDAWRRALKALPSCSTGGRPNYILVPCSCYFSHIFHPVWFVRWTGNALRHGRPIRVTNLLLTVTQFHLPHRHFPG